MNRTNRENIFGQCVVCQVFEDDLKPRLNSCERCYYFFLRIIHFTQELYSCQNKNCQVDRRIGLDFCTYCRFVKCIAAGMGSQRQNFLEEIRALYELYGI
ncbi:unnamed protein product [Brachionus calyciflorus]|uniref:Nuclear receptor domain-containing protein n=1 Tax=Brachionus calyciflorus TaxID=104777 RepID=A0A813N942_9BILA|nr:unnamed protein product [Brachionus calyciflorus]